MHMYAAGAPATRTRQPRPTTSGGGVCGRMLAAAWTRPTLPEWVGARAEKGLPN